jgi:hypothetical protein
MDPRLIRSRKTFCSIGGRRFAASEEDVLQHRRKTFCNIGGRRFATSEEGVLQHRMKAFGRYAMKAFCRLENSPSYQKLGTNYLVSILV